MTRTLAFYLPQFHAIPENDEWWGDGFTEWDNVRRANPRFAGHRQPAVPGALGYYDLTDPEARAAQAALARQFGVDGFCYYHYWFRGRRLLDRPFADVLRSGDPDLPFSLCWANEPWTRSWSGGGEVLVPQQYDATDDLEHIRWLCTAFADPRYERVDGKPLFLVYRANQLPDARRTTDAWRAEAARLGIGDLHLVRVESFRDEHADPRGLGFDAAVEFQPDWRNVRPNLLMSAARKAARKVGMNVSQPAYTTHAYDDVVATALARPPASYVRYPCVTPAWDNTPRRSQGAVVLTGSTPARYGHWLRATLAREPRLVFVNAWNEWGEGAHLEPCEQWGTAYLEAHRDARAAHAAPSGSRS